MQKKKVKATEQNWGCKHEKKKKEKTCNSEVRKVHKRERGAKKAE